MDAKHEEILITRLRRWHERLEGALLRATVPLSAEFTSGPPLEDTRFEVPGPAAAWRPITEGETWGQAWETGWFRLRGTVPAAWTNRSVVAHLDIGSEGLVLRPDGTLLQGITTGSIWEPTFKRVFVPLFDACRGGESVELLIEATAASLFGIFTEPDPPPTATDRHGHYDAQVRRLRLAVFDLDAWGLRLDLRMLLGLITRLPEKSVRRARLVHAGNAAADLFAGGPSRARACRARLSGELYRPADSSAPRATAVGHAHIDTAWLWPIEEGVRKCARTFATQVGLLRRYPEYVFGASQAQHYAFIKERHPALHEEIRRLVSEGRWEVQGGMWVEADCNLIDGESMVRQILHGKLFFREEFGVEVDNLWLPDVFGYSAALPQILRRSGIDSFLTQKLSWNQWNNFPHTTFVWRGIDGSEVTAHFPPENTYNSPLDSAALIPGGENFRERGYLDEFLTLFGVGDGGGGPNEEHLECGRRGRDLEGMPRVTFGRASDFFARLRERRAELPVWSGELYLELHRGTLTSQADVKRGNRQLEQDLRAAEILWSLRPLAEYPAAEFDSLWKLLLLHQFHDILPGSSIRRTYERTRRDHAAGLERCGRLIREAVPGEDRAGDAQAESNAITLFHPHDARFLGPVELPGFLQGGPAQEGLPVTGTDGEAVRAQVEDGLLVVEASIPPLGFAVLKRSALPAHDSAHGQPNIPVPCLWLPVQAGSGPLLLENARVRYEFTEDGRLLRAVDLEIGRAILCPEDEGNRLTLFEDRPNDWDAWDVDVFYAKARAEEARGERVFRLERRDGGDPPVRRGLRFDLRIGDSRMRQTLFLGDGSKRLDFVTHVDWRERHRMLRTAFTVNVRAEQATYEIQYGHLRRPTHENTSWDQARFEVPAHRWVDLAEHGFGVALLNDGKYGHRVLDRTLELNLLRAPAYPDPDCDRGQHAFTYSFLPHGGSLAEVRAEAAALNRPPLLLPGSAGSEFPLALEGEGLSLAVLKRAEREDCRILRLVETLGRTSHGRLIVRPPGGTLVVTDLLESDEIGPVHRTGESLDLTLGPFEIRTYKWKGWR